MLYSRRFLNYDSCMAGSFVDCSHQMSLIGVSYDLPEAEVAWGENNYPELVTGGRGSNSRPNTGIKLY